MRLMYVCRLGLRLVYGMFFMSFDAWDSLPWAVVRLVLNWVSLHSTEVLQNSTILEFCEGDDPEDVPEDVPRDVRPFVILFCFCCSCSVGYRDWGTSPRTSPGQLYTGDVPEDVPRPVFLIFQKQQLLFLIPNSLGMFPRYSRRIVKHVLRFLLG
ncbi:hypothetical protein Dimus_037908 [Dionaea muscipula]